MTAYVDRRSAIKAELREIDELVLLADAAEELAVRGHLARLAVIRMSGFIESAVQHMANAYLEEHSSHRVLAFAQTQVGKQTNLNPTNLERLVGNFDAQWRAELTDFLAQDERRQSLGNLIGARHKLAHGGSQAISTANMHTYHRLTEEVVKFLLGRFLPLPRN
ncbi:HEPN domain-containing protein [Propionicicella superfundia]|uniref:HEPN domain-containing protein n=1 Tax=Propionicicella superfundia TaxID=348582 RepID=UPI00041CD5F5|nr:HEPN domain-containing protein [Propionicicella superfundia]